MKINQLVKMAHDNSVKKGFWEDKREFGTSLALIHSEISEALEDERAGKGYNEVYFEGEKPCGIPTELADAVIRIADLCGAYGIDLEKAIETKMVYNTTRPFKHGKKL